MASLDDINERLIRIEDKLAAHISEHTLVNKIITNIIGICSLILGYLISYFTGRLL